ncbi:MAG: flavin reductase [Clostridia bacterium]|nr:flavin reductase [Clostridia bacterium]
MKNIKTLDKISQGMYVLTTENGGCLVDAVSQISFGDNPLVTVSVMKKNYTNELLRQNSKFAISILGKDINPEIIKTFGFNSMRDINKFEKVETTEIDGVKVIDGSLGYMICEKVDSIDNDTHTLFIGKVIEADLIKDEEAMTYAYYQENKEDLLKVKTENGETAWICTVCGYIYYGEEVPDDYKCPVCKVGKELFKKQEEK